MNFDSIAGGATYLPPEVLKRSLIRPVMREEAVGVELALVAGVQPAVVGQRLGGLLGQVVVAVHHARALDQDLVVLADLDLAARERRADGAELVVVGVVDEGAGGGLGQAVALEDQDAGGVEPLGDVVVERGRAGDEEADPAAEAVADLAEDQLVEEPVLER